MGIYVAAKQTLISATGLRNRLDLMGVWNLGEPINFHSTVIASRQEFPADQLVLPTQDFTGIIREWTVFNSKYDNPDGDKCLVGLLDCPVLDDLHAQALALGATSEYDSYHPHITVSYKYKQKLNLKTIPVDYLVWFSSDFTVQPLEYY